MHESKHFLPGQFVHSDFVRPKINLFLFYTNNNKLGNGIESLATIYF
jgi:hypothetical protein